MAIKYEIHSIHNSKGEGGEQKFVRLRDHEPMTSKQIEQHIEQACSLTRGDVQAVMTSLHDLIVTELSQGARFYLPQIGYLSLSVTTELPEGKTMDKVTGNNIRLRNINFKPTAELLNEVGRNVRFERSKYTTKSRRYTEEQLWDKIVAFIKEHDYICRRDMEYHFSLRQQTALKWLKHFTEKGLLVKEGAINAPIYFLAKGNKGNEDNEDNEDNGISLHTKRPEP